MRPLLNNNTSILHQYIQLVIYIYIYIIWHKDPQAEYQTNLTLTLDVENCFKAVFDYSYMLGRFDFQRKCIYLGLLMKRLYFTFTVFFSHFDLNQLQIKHALVYLILFYKND